MSRRNTTYILFFCALAAWNIGWLDPVKDGVEDGNRQYLLGKYDDAMKSYSQAQGERPDSPELHYNIGNVQFKKNDVEQAAREYLESATSTEDNDVKATSLYNLGNAYMAQGNGAEAVESYKKALRLNPKDEDAKYNLELAMLQMQQQQPQQKQENKDKQETPTPQENQTPQPQQREESTPTPQEGEQGQEATPTPQPQPEEGDATPSVSPTPMDREQFELLLDRLDQKEKDIRKELQGTPRPYRVEKDW